MLGVLFVTFLVVIAARAVQLQIYRGPWLSQKASDQYERSYTSAGKRGTIYDRNFREMAISIDVNSIAAYPARVKNAHTTGRALAKILKQNPRQIIRKLAAHRSFVWIKRQATAKQARAVRDLGLEGIGFIPEYNRFYPNTTLAAQLLGFTGLDGDGLEGVEFYYDRYLRGKDRNVTVFKDALGRGFNAENQQVPATSGGNLVLTIDSYVQYIAESALAETVTNSSARSAMAIVMVPKTGEILALANYPFYNPNTYRKFSKERRRNRAITDPFEPGSTMKIFSAAAALESGKITPRTIFFCENGAYRIGKNVVHDSSKHGWLSLQQIVKYSSNIGAVKVSQKIGPKILYHTLRRFGFGEKTGIDCPGETAGSLTHYARWADIDAGSIAYGYGISVSALQLITAVAAIANDGLLMQPYVVQAILDQNNKPVKNFKPQPVRRVVSRRTAGIVKRIMQTVITEGGTGTRAALEGYTVCGKTGTVQKIDRDGKYSNKAHIASFIGFAPADKPAVAILVVVDEPQGAYYGGVVAAPAFKKIALETLNHLNIPPRGKGPKITASRGREASG